MRFAMECMPAFNFARDKHTSERTDDGFVFTSAKLRLALDISCANVKSSFRICQVRGCVCVSCVVCRECVRRDVGHCVALSAAAQVIHPTRHTSHATRR